MRCQNPDCRRELDEDAAFCKYCGTPVPDDEPSGDAVRDGDSPLTCPNPECGRPAPPGSMFCERCGTRLVPDGSPAAGGTSDGPVDGTVAADATGPVDAPGSAATDAPGDDDGFEDWEDMDDWTAGEESGDAPVPASAPASGPEAMPEFLAEAFGTPSPTGAFGSPSPSEDFPEPSAPVPVAGQPAPDTAPGKPFGAAADSDAPAPDPFDTIGSFPGASDTTGSFAASQGESDRVPPPAPPEGGFAPMPSPEGAPASSPAPADAFEQAAAPTGAFEAQAGGAGSTGSFEQQPPSPDATDAAVPPADAKTGKRGGKGKVVAAVVAGVAVLAAVGVGALLLSRGNGGAPSRQSPDLTRSLVPSDLTGEAAAELAKREAARVPVTHPAVSRDWVGEQRFVAGEMRADNVYPPSSSTSDVWVADLTQAYQADACMYERHWELSCGWDKSASEWRVYSLDDLGADDPLPTRGITDEEAVAGVAVLLQEAKPAPGNTDDHPLGLPECYSNGLAAEVEGNLYDDKAGTVKASVGVTGTHGLGTYRGTLAASLSWASSGGTFGWGLDECVADADAWKPDYEPLVVGTWRGSFLKTGYIAMGNSGQCYGGRATPVVMVVKAVDSVTRTMTVDLSFVVHDHPATDSDQESSEGDGVTEAHDVPVTFEPGMSVKAYSEDGFSVEMTFPGEGTKIGLDTKTESRGDRLSRTDSYDLVRDEGSPEQTSATVPSPARATEA